PTPRELAAWLALHDAPDAAPAVAPDGAGASALLHLGGAPGAPMVFLVHDIGGRASAYASMAAALVRHGYAVAALQLTGHEAHMPDSFEALLARALAAIRQRQPAGPYRLAGHSYGGVLAAHLAGRLEALGERVAFLGVLDTVPPPPGEAPLAAAADPLERCMYIAAACAQAAGARAPSFERADFAALPDSSGRWRAIADALAPLELWPGVDAVAELAALDRAFALLARLPAPSLPLLRTAPEVWNCAAHADDFAPAWAASSVQPVCSHRCAGDHVSMLEGASGAALGAALAAAIARGDNIVELSGSID
ncbi:alpha/beta fold hydrolase, partial [Janthinobacterium sp. PC23-8]|uniref:alpha/beta fold hydrolase n=1 Tax=Janthinobacterium sp. PC23-8 TaxID=2012679 RepID=UPI000BC92C0C